MNLESVMGSILSVVAMILAIIVFGAMVLAGIYFYMNHRRYSQFKCIVWEKDGFGQLNEVIDKGGIFVDPKTKNKRLFMKKFNVGLNPDNVPYIPSGNKKIVYLLRTGLKNFRFIRPTITDMDVSLSVGEEDVNWAINAYERQKHTFWQNTFMQYLPLISITFVSIIILILFIYFFKEFTVLKDMATEFKETAKILAQANSGTVILD